MRLDFIRLIEEKLAHYKENMHDYTNWAKHYRDKYFMNDTYPVVIMLNELCVEFHYYYDCYETKIYVSA